MWTSVGLQEASGGNPHCILRLHVSIDLTPSFFCSCSHISETRNDSLASLDRLKNSHESTERQGLTNSENHDPEDAPAEEGESLLSKARVEVDYEEEEENSDYHEEVEGESDPFKLGRVGSDGHQEGHVEAKDGDESEALESREGVEVDHEASDSETCHEEDRVEGEREAGFGSGEVDGLGDSAEVVLEPR